MKRWTKLAPVVLGTLWLSACGDDESAAGPLVSPPDGGDAAVVSSEPSMDEDSGTPAPSWCSNIALECADYDDVDGLGNLCLRTAADDDAAQCEALSETCDAVCKPNGEPPAVSEAARNVTAEECDRQVGEPCHPEDFGTGLGALCHRVGHSGNVAWCAAVYDQCVELCGGAEPVPGTDAGPTDAATDAGGVALTLQFRAVVGDQPFACGAEYTNVGTSHSTVTPQDFRFYVSDVALIDAQGREVPFTIDEAAPYQGGGVALLDFEDASGACQNGNEPTNTVISGTAPAGVYTAIRFSTAVPLELNHQDPTTLPAPLQAGDMTWGWLYGYKFIKAELLEVASTVDAATHEMPTALDAGGSGMTAMDAGGMHHGAMGDGSAPMLGAGVLHVGSTACSNAPSADAGDDFAAGPITSCQLPNRNAITLVDFDPSTSVIVADVAAMFAAADLSQMAMCHSGQPECAPMFDTVGIDWESGQASDTQSAFRVEE